MSTTTREKLDEMMPIYSNRINDIGNVINSLETKINALIDKKELLENETLDPLKIRMDEILDLMDHDGTLYKNKYYGEEDLQGWAWYKDLGYSASNLTYIDDDTFYIDKSDRTLQAGQYLLVKDSKYGYMERYIKKVVKTGTITKVYLDTQKGPLSNPISKQESYVSHMNLYPSCEDPGKMPDRTDCCDYDDKDFPTCEDAAVLEWKYIETEIEGSGTQQIEVQGGLPPYSWEVQNTNDFQLSWDQTEGTRNILTYNYNGVGTLINVRDYCGGFIEEEIMPPEYDYLPGVVKIIVDKELTCSPTFFFTTVFINDSSGKYNQDLTFILDEIGTNYRKIYIQDSYPFNSGNNLYLTITKTETNRVNLQFGANLNNSRNIFYLYYGADLDDNLNYARFNGDQFTEHPYTDNFIYYPNGCHLMTFCDHLIDEPVHYSTLIARNIAGVNINFPVNPREDYDKILKDSGLAVNYSPFGTTTVCAWNQECPDWEDYDWPEPCYDVPTGDGPLLAGPLIDSTYRPRYEEASYTFHMYFDIQESIGAQGEDCYQEWKEMLDRMIWTCGTGTRVPYIAIDATDGKLFYRWHEDLYYPNKELIRSNKSSWSGDTLLTFAYDHPTKKLSLYINGNLDKTETLTISAATNPDYYPYYPYTESFIGYFFCDYGYAHGQKDKPIKAISKGFRYYSFSSSTGRINMDIADMKDTLTYYERIAVPKRVES